MVAHEDELRRAVEDPRVLGRYWDKVKCDAGGTCWWWTGAIAGNGHGRFWISSGFVIIAQRFAWALAYGVDTMPPVVAHRCDNPLCQRPFDLKASTPSENRAEWAARRHRLGSPLRDMRGARGRAHELRAAVRAGRRIDDVIASGSRPVDVDQLPLW